MKSLTLGSFLAALALFFFGAAFWISPFPYGFVEKPTLGEEALGRLLRESLPRTGLYLVPGTGTAPEEATRLYKQGPVATIHYRAEGVDSMSPSVFIRGFLVSWVTTALLALILRLGGGARYGTRLTQVVASGLAAAVYLRLGDGIWWFQPWPWLVLTDAYDLAAFTVAGLVLAAFVKPAAVPVPVT
jgi:hypothetical protein